LRYIDTLYYTRTDKDGKVVNEYVYKDIASDEVIKSSSNNKSESVKIFGGITTILISLYALKNSSLF